MKLLLITDNPIVIQYLEKVQNGYQLGSIFIDFLLIQKSDEVFNLENQLKQQKYHLILGLTQGKFVGEYISSETVVNAVNNYLDLPLRFDENKFEPHDVKQPPTSIVNRTTSYFNVFLEIPKAVSLTHEDQTIELSLSRLDVDSLLNYYLAYPMHKHKANYYILNYQGEFPTNYLIDLFHKLD
ncbi:MAG: hypothetical protein JNL75_00685 [Chitinophagales bacterium]|nr:hypothetical protein [Chitinophagales bacterium]